MTAESAGAVPSGGERRTTGEHPADERPRPTQPLRIHAEADPRGRRLLILAFPALGVVYGAIGTSPLYALRECFKPEYGIRPTLPSVYGVLSLIIWSRVLVGAVKYIVFIMRADNRGEGGIFALLALILQRTHREGDWLTRT